MKTLLIAGAAFVTGALLAGWLVRQQHQVEAARLAEVTAQRETATLRIQLARTAAAQARGDALMRDLDAALESNRSLRKERDRALAQVTTGRECLSADAVRLLNHPDHRAVSVPEPSGQSAAADAGGSASDRDVAAWAADVQQQYRECAERLNTLIEWHERDMQQGGMP